MLNVIRVKLTPGRKLRVGERLPTLNGGKEVEVIKTEPSGHINAMRDDGIIFRGRCPADAIDARLEQWS